MNLFEEYMVELKIRERICGGIPISEDQIEGWLRGRGLLPKEAATRAKKIREEVGEEKYIEEESKSQWTTFKKDEHGIYLEPRQIRALIKESAFILELTKNVRGLRQRLQHGLVIKPDRIYLQRDGKNITEVDGQAEGPIHVMGPQGPRTALKRQDYVLAPTIKFQIRVVTPMDEEETKYLTSERLRAVFEWAEDGIGLGASRSQDEGKFDIIRFIKTKQ